MNRFQRGLVAAAAAAFLVASGIATTAVATGAHGGDATDHASLSLPARGAFSYPWFPEAWDQNNIDPASHYTPSLGYYHSTGVMAEHVQALLYGGFQFDVSSWWGRGSKEDTRFGDLLTAAHGTALKIVPYYEGEGQSTSYVPDSPNPDPSEIATDLDYIAAHYIDDPNYLWIAGKPALFVYGDASDDCGMVDRWMHGNSRADTRFYLVLKVFPGYTECNRQPDNWHQYGPAVAEDTQGDHSFSISPGYYKYDESTPRLTRNLDRWTTDVNHMTCSGADFQLVTTFNEWGEGTAVESSTSWASPSGYGDYLDVLHAHRSCGTGSPSPTTTSPTPSPTTTSPTPTPTTTSPTPSPTTTSPTPSPTTTSPTPTPTTTSPSPSGHKVLVVLEENHNRTDAMSSMPYLASLASTYGQATGYDAITHPSLPNYFAIWGGSTFGVSSDCSVGESGCVPTAPSVWGQTLAAGRTAKAYQEDMPSNCDPSGSGDYAPRHSPWPYWTDSTERGFCNANDVPSGTTSSGPLLTDVRNGTLPITGELTPNLCNDAHDCSLGTADSWLQSWLPVIMAGPDYTNGRLTIIVTFDEGDSTSNNVAFVVVDPRLHGVTVTGSFNHYSLTRWLDDNAGVSRLRNASSAADLRAAFGL